ncbi:MAG: DinB family protein [Anaerolineae bacterium]|nr:DinB family protein [Anaerolineae bacterium]
MHETIKWLLTIINNEYNGNSFNGPNLVKTIQQLTLEQVVSTDNFEGYSVWGIVLHLMKWKYELAKALGNTDLEPFPYDGDNFPLLPDVRTPEAWDNTLRHMDRLHAAFVDALAVFDPTKLDEAMVWGCTYGEAIAWMTTHDAYHTAQIRNMGLEIHFP